MHELLFIAFIGIIIAGFLFEKFLDYLNSTRMSEILPAELEGIYDGEKYARQQAYQRENLRFGLISGSFSFAVTLAMFLFYGFAWVDQLARGISVNPVVISLIFFGIIMWASDLLGIPFSVYDTFRIEEKYGFNKTTPGIFVLDTIKGWFLGALIGGGILALIMVIYRNTGTMFWIYAWIVISGFSIFMSMFYSTLIVPLFNKQTPLPEGELRNAIRDFAEKTGFRLDNIYVIDGSKRSTKANAYFAGLGSKKRIVLYDTLINEMQTEEIVAVLAHETGHYKKKHVMQGLIFSIIQTGIILYIFSRFVENPVLSMALGVEEPSFHIGLVAFGVLYTPVSFILGIFINIRSRKNEFQADAYAAEYYHADALASALKKLSVRNLSNLTPHPWYVFFSYSHPPLLQRLDHLQKIKNHHQ